MLKATNLKQTNKKRILVNSSKDIELPIEIHPIKIDKICE